MSKKIYILFIIAVIIVGVLLLLRYIRNNKGTVYITPGVPVTLSDEPIQLEDGLSAVQFEGDYKIS